jgi:SAM-dependent methyltransferase
LRDPVETFAEYATWYNAFNTGKDYAAEAAYILDKVKRWCPAPQTWLDIGCGTGNHLASLRSRDIAVAGVDISPGMVAQARLAHPEIPFYVGSAQDFRAPGQWDVISMLFHVLSYQITDTQVRQALSNIGAHLEADGIVAFDFWHTDGVLHDPPAFRMRETLVGNRRLFRLSHPLENRELRQVHVRYEFRWDSVDGPLTHEERHSMRHFTADELQEFLSGAGFAVMGCEGWMREGTPTAKDWYGLMFARKRRAP